MPAIVPAEPRRRAALAALLAPVIGMVGLFAWAGAQSSQSTTSFAASFIDAYDSGNCQVFFQDLYQAAGTAQTTCAGLHQPTIRKFLGCTLTLESGASTAGAGTPTPSGFSDRQTVLAKCRSVSLYLEIAKDDATGGLRVIGAQAAP